MKPPTKYFCYFGSNLIFFDDQLINDHQQIRKRTDEVFSEWYF